MKTTLKNLTKLKMSKMNTSMIFVLIIVLSVIGLYMCTCNKRKESAFLFETGTTTTTVAPEDTTDAPEDTTDAPEDTTDAPTTLAPTTLAPTTLAPTTLAPTTTALGDGVGSFPVDTPEPYTYVNLDTNKRCQGSSGEKLVSLCPEHLWRTCGWSNWGHPTELKADGTPNGGWVCYARDKKSRYLRVGNRCYEDAECAHSLICAYKPGKFAGECRAR